MEADELGRRLRMAREDRGLSQQAVADALGLPRTAVTQLEAGKRSVSTLELSRFSELYLCPVADFLQEGVRDEDVLVHCTVSRRDWNRTLPRMSRLPAASVCAVRGVRLENLLGANPRSGPPSYEMRVPRSSGEAVAQGEQTAEQERRRLGIGTAPNRGCLRIDCIPGHLGLRRRASERNVGSVLRHPSIGSAILVNSSHPRGRKRFSYAHEYAHALLDRDRNVTVSSTDNSSEMVERRANAFAAAVLMPRNGIYEALRSLDKGSRAGRSRPSSMPQAVATSRRNFVLRRVRNALPAMTSPCSHIILA